MQISEGGSPASPENTELSAAIVEEAGSAICVLDRNGRIIRWNRAACALTGISSDQARNRVFRDFVLFPPDLEIWSREFDRIFAGAAPGDLQVRWRALGGVRQMQCLCSGIRGGGDLVTHLVCIVAGNAARIEALSATLLADREAESLDISRFLHGTVAQDLVALSFEVGQSDGMTATAANLIDRCCRDIRLLAYMLAPPMLPGCTLTDSVAYFITCLREDAGMSVEAQLDAISTNLPLEGQWLLAAVLQQWANRAIRHRTGANFHIRLGNAALAGSGPGGFEPSASAAGPEPVYLEPVYLQPVYLELEARWNDPAPSPAADQLLHGWTALRERARALGGDFDIAANPTRVFARLSLPQPALS